MTEYNKKLIEVISLLGKNWKVDDYQLAGMGWAAVLSNDTQVMTLHSERGWVDIYLGPYTDHKVLACKQSASEIAKVIAIVASKER